MASELESSENGFTALSSTLWRLREVLDQLLFKVFQTELVVRSGEFKWLARTTRELDAALQEARNVEVLRAVETVALADRLGVPPELTAAQLVRLAGPPWDSILDDHREALVSLTSDIARAAADVPAVEVDEDDPDEADLVRKFLAETLANATPASLAAFLA
jgi:hypothetical protein